MEYQYGWRMRDPCWVSGYMWHTVVNKRRDACVQNVVAEAEPVATDKVDTELFG